MVDLVVDVCILISGSGKGDDAKRNEVCRELLDLLAGKDGASLALDDERVVLSHYELRCNPDTFARSWLADMLNKGKVVYVRRRRVDRGVRTAFKEIGFVGEDFEKYVRTAASSADRALASHDPHYFAAKARKLLKKRLDVTPLNPSEARSFIA